MKKKGAGALLLMCRNGTLERQAEVLLLSRKDDFSASDGITLSSYFLRQRIAQQEYRQIKSKEKTK